MALASPSGIQTSFGSRLLRESVELLSSMRFAISLLTLLCIASVIGTVIKQNEPAVNYVNQFGPFWAEVFGALGLYTVYSTPWFLVILAVLVVSTSLCIARNTPKFLREFKTFKEGVRVQSLRAFPDHVETTLPVGREAALAKVSAWLAEGGWRARAQVREDGTMVAAHKGRANKIGYLAAHSAIVLICLGGMLDGDLIVRLQMLAQGKEPFTGGGRIGDIDPKHFLSERNPTYRGNLLVPEGERAGTAVLQMPKGIVLQPLPFDVELKKFIVEYYPTGMPKLFASHVIIHDRETGEAKPATIEVNKPAEHRGVLIYQSSFDDGGSKVELRGLPLDPGAAAFPVTGRIGGSTGLRAVAPADGAASAPATTDLQLEFAALRVINVENLANAAAAGADGSEAEPSSMGAAAVAANSLWGGIDQHLGSGAKGDGKKHLSNVGPSITYRLRDASNQAREYHNYMQPMTLEGQRVFLLGVRENTRETFRYLRVPADDKLSLDGWWRLRQALASPAMRAEAASRYAKAATPDGQPEMTPALQATAQRTLDLFAGKPEARAAAAAAAAAASAATPMEGMGGLPGLSAFISSSVPEPDRARMSEVLLRVLNGAMYELYKIARAQAGMPALSADAETQAFMSQAVLALSDSMFYPAPLIFALDGFDQVQASVFQVARAPGKTLVYLGAVLLIIGVFAMLYVRERRLWVWLGAGADGSADRTPVLAAMSSTRQGLEAQTEFQAFREALLKDVPR